MSLSAHRLLTPSFSRRFFLRRNCGLFHFGVIQQIRPALIGELLDADLSAAAPAYAATGGAGAAAGRSVGTAGFGGAIAAGRGFLGEAAEEGVGGLQLPRILFHILGNQLVILLC